MPNLPPVHEGQRPSAQWHSTLAEMARQGDSAPNAIVDSLGITARGAVIPSVGTRAYGMMFGSNLPAISSATWTVVEITNATPPSLNVGRTTGSDAKFTIQKAGVYLCDGQVGLQCGHDTTQPPRKFQLQPSRNGGKVTGFLVTSHFHIGQSGVSVTTGIARLQYMWTLAVDDYVQLEVWHEESTTTYQLDPQFSIVKVS